MRNLGVIRDEPAFSAAEVTREEYFFCGPSPGMFLLISNDLWNIPWFFAHCEIPNSRIVTSHAELSDKHHIAYNPNETSWALKHWKPYSYSTNENKWQTDKQTNKTKTEEAYSQLPWVCLWPIYTWTASCSPTHLSWYSTEEEKK